MVPGQGRAVTRHAPPAPTTTELLHRKEVQWREDDAQGEDTAHKTVETLTHEEARRKNIPTAEYQSVMQKEAQSPVRVAYERRNRDLDPQLVWKGKDEQDARPRGAAVPIHIQEKIHPKALIDDLLKQTRQPRQHEVGTHLTSSPTSTASPRTWRRPSSTSTTRTGPIA